MMNLISWTGWTKEDWIENLKIFGESLAFPAFMLMMFFVPGLFG